MSSYSSQHLAETAEIVQKLDPETLKKMVDWLADIRHRGGRWFFLGVGDSAANASHEVNDFREIAGLEVMHLPITFRRLRGPTLSDGPRSLLKC